MSVEKVKVLHHAMVSVLQPDESAVTFSIPLLYVDPKFAQLRPRAKAGKKAKRPAGHVARMLRVQAPKGKRRQARITFELHERTYALLVADSWLRSAHLLNSDPDMPLFVLVSDDLYYDEDPIYSMGDFDVNLLPPEPGSPAEEELNRVVIESVTRNSALLSETSNETFVAARATVIDIVMQLVNGDSKGLVQAYAYVNPFNKLVQEGPVSGKKFSADEQLLTHIKNHLSRLLFTTSPAAVYSGNTGTEHPEKYLQGINEFEDIMRANGLEDTFTDLISTKVEEQQIQQRPESVADQIAYLSQPLTLLPRKMRKLSPKLAELPYSQKTWDVADVDNLVQNGDDLAGAFVVIATRLGRLEESGFARAESIHPSLVLANAMTLPGEQSIGWAVKDMLQLYLKGRKLAYQDIMLATTADAEGPALLFSPLGTLYHSFGHALISEEVPLGQARIAFTNVPLVGTFVEDVYEHHAEQSEDECFSMKSTLGLFGLGFPLDELAKQIAEAAGILADISLHKNTEFTPASPEWQQAHDAWIERFVFLSA